MTRKAQRRLAALAAAIGCCALGSSGALAGIPPSAGQSKSFLDGNCWGFHAGHQVGDGEFSDGAMISAKHISCSHALGIVKPHYRHILHLEGLAGTPTGSFRLGRFQCHWRLEGPNATKRCAAGRQQFTFI